MQSNSHFRWTVDKAWLNSVDYWETLLIMIKMSCGQFQRHYLEENTCKIAGSAHESRTGDNIKKKKEEKWVGICCKSFCANSSSAMHPSRLHCVTFNEYETGLWGQ